MITRKKSIKLFALLIIITISTGPIFSQSCPDSATIPSVDNQSGALWDGMIDGDKVLLHFGDSYVYTGQQAFSAVVLFDTCGNLILNEVIQQQHSFDNSWLHFFYADQFIGLNAQYKPALYDTATDYYDTTGLLPAAADTGDQWFLVTLVKPWNEVWFWRLSGLVGSSTGYQQVIRYHPLSGQSHLDSIPLPSSIDYWYPTNAVISKAGSVIIGGGANSGSQARQNTNTYAVLNPQLGIIDSFSVKPSDHFPIPNLPNQTGAPSLSGIVDIHYHNGTWSFLTRYGNGQGDSAVMAYFEMQNGNRVPQNFQTFGDSFSQSTHTILQGDILANGSVLMYGTRQDTTGKQIVLKTLDQHAHPVLDTAFRFRYQGNNFTLGPLIPLGGERFMLTGMIKAVNYDFHYQKMFIPLQNDTSSGVGLTENSRPEAISLYPNPANETLHLQSALPLKDYRLRDLQGRLRAQGRLFQNKLELPHLAPGLYLLEVETEMGRRYQKKLIIK